MKIRDIIRQALAEDTGDGDHTSLSTIPAYATGKAQLIVKQDGILAGLPFAMEVFTQVDPATTFEIRMNDGDRILPGDVVFTVTGNTRAILSAERVALNFLQRLSGIATYTNALVTRISPYKTKLLDTRKTTPLLREMEKYAVRTGGGFNHRMGLYDMIMIKDNHVDFSGGISKAINSVHAYLAKMNRSMQIEIEVRNFGELEEVLACGGVNRIMLDNFSPADLALAIMMIGGRYETEASGGIHAGNIEAYAATGVDYISMGALTHQIRSLDMSLKAV